MIDDGPRLPPRAGVPGGPPGRRVAHAVVLDEHEAPPVRSRRSTLTQLWVTAVLVVLGGVVAVLVTWYVPADLDSCPADRSVLECSDAMLATIVPGLAAVAALLVWLVGSVARERRGGLVWCWVAVVVAALPATFLVPGLVV